MSYKALADSLARRWLVMVPAFSPDLKDTGQVYRGNPVLYLEYSWPHESTAVRVYRYTQANSEHSFLAFVPEDVE